MPVTSLGPSSRTPGGSAAAPAAPAAAPPAATSDGGPVGHGVTRLVARRQVYGQNAPFIPGTPPPTQETAGAHGAHKGRISIR
jgi:hypothetical protein